MCIATAALIAGIAGTGVATAGAISAGNARSDAARYQAQVARNNAIIADQKAIYAIQAGDVESGRQGAKNRATMGKIKTAQAASGLDVNTGSPVDVRAGNAETGMQDVLTTKNDALLRAYGYRAQGADATAQADLDEQAASSAKTAGYLEGAASLLGGASSLGTKWAGLQGGAGSGANKTPMGGGF